MLERFKKIYKQHLKNPSIEKFEDSEEDEEIGRAHV